VNIYSLKITSLKLTSILINLKFFRCTHRNSNK